MYLTLARCACACDKKFHLIMEFQPWLEALKELNTDLQAEHTKHCAELEAMTKSMCNKACDDCTLSDPSCKYNNPLNSTSGKSAPSSNAPPHHNLKDYQIGRAHV